MNISKNVLALTPEELSQAAYLHQKNRIAANAKIPTPSPGALRKDGTKKRFVYLETIKKLNGETQVYLDNDTSMKIEKTYSKDLLTGFLTSEQNYTV